MSKVTYIDNLLRRSSAAETIYVRTTGDDTDDGSSGSPLRQPQAAINMLKRRANTIEHAVVIDVGSGTFNGFAVEGLRIGASVSGEGSLTVQGTFAAPTVDGLTSGTSTGGSTTTLVDTGGGWTVNQLKGKLLLVDSEYRVVLSNTATQINMASAFSASTSTKAYSIVEPKSVISTVDSFVGVSCIYVAGCTTTWRKNLVFSGFDIQAPASTFSGFYAFETGGVQVKNSFASCSSAGNNGFTLQSVGGECSCEDVYVSGDIDDVGVNIVASNYCRALRGFADTLDGKGFAVQYGQRAEAIDVSAEGCGSVGMGVYGCGAAAISRAYFDSNGSTGLKIDNSWVRAESLSGGSNTGYGVSVLPRSHFEFAGTPTLTGTTDDATINEGTSDLNWSTNFSSNGDVASNTDTMASILRRD